MKAQKAKALAAELLKIGTSKIWVSPVEKQRVAEAMTKEDLRLLIKDGVIKKKKLAEKSKKRALGRKKGRKRGFGKRRGTAKARENPKQKWMESVRAQRKKLKDLRAAKTKLKIPYRKAYLMVKGGYFRGKKHLETTVVEGGKK